MFCASTFLQFRAVVIPIFAESTKSALVPAVLVLLQVFQVALAEDNDLNDVQALLKSFKSLNKVLPCGCITWLCYSIDVLPDVSAIIDILLRTCCTITHGRQASTFLCRTHGE